jgi:hypothetical protein
MDILTTIYTLSRLTIFLFPHSAIMSASLLPKNRKSWPKPEKEEGKRE